MVGVWLMAVGRRIWQQDPRRFSRLTSVIVTIAMATISGAPSAAIGKAVEFEVASLKVDPSPRRPPLVAGQPVTGGVLPGGRFVMTYVTLRTLIVRAYDRRGLSDYIYGAPAGVDLLHFNIDAKFDPRLAGAKEGGISVPCLMLRRLLEERFRLRVHFETRETPILALVVPDRNRRLGPQLQPASGRCVLPAVRPGAQPAGDLAALAAAKPPNCPIGGGPGQLTGSSLGMDRLAIMLGVRLRMKVIDRAGLEGLFDVELTYRPDDTPVTIVERLEGESLSRALEHQLGLKLEKMTGPIDVLVVDAVERPSAD